MPQLALSLRGVVKRFGAIAAVDGLDLDVPEGTCVGLLGPTRTPRRGRPPLAGFCFAESSRDPRFGQAIASGVKQ